MFAIKNLVSEAFIAYSGSREYLESVLAQIDTDPSSHEIVEISAPVEDVVDVAAE